MDDIAELDITHLPGSDGVQTDPRCHEVMDAIDAASDQDRRTWLISDGKRVAAIVPVSDAETLASWYG